MNEISDIEESLAFKLMKLILRLIRESGATREEAVAALRAAEALVPEQGLARKATSVIQT
jgi:cellobiose-specific phosphotransferase system component IIA